MESLLSPGDMVMCRSTDSLVVWSTYKSSFDDDAGFVSADEIMLILKVRKTTKKEQNNVDYFFTDEWKQGAYKIVSSSGVVGWVGAGWVAPIF